MESSLAPFKDDSPNCIEKALIEKEQMIAIVTHDIKNPLFAIQLEAQMLLRTVERSEKSTFGEEVKIQVNRILKTTDKMKTLIADLLDKKKTENGLSNLSYHNVNVSQLLNETLESFRPLVLDKKIKLQRHVNGNIYAYIDRNKIYQVFSNLLSNAIKFTPASGIIQIHLEETKGEFIFKVIDSGPGLEIGQKKKIFEKYWIGESDHCGSGLGLFICRTIVEAHGGKINVESPSSGGACFYFSISKSKQHVIFNNPLLESRPENAKKVYIIDDDEDLREVMAWALRNEGFSVYCFKSPVEALDTLKDSDSSPDLIIVDYQMDEMKGSEFILKRSRLSGQSDCPILVISASPQDAKNELCPSLYKKIITKPIDLVGLVDNVLNCLL